MKIIPLEEVQWRDQQEKASQIKVPMSRSTQGWSPTGRTVAWGWGAVGVGRGGYGCSSPCAPMVVDSEAVGAGEAVHHVWRRNNKRRLVQSWRGIHGLLDASISDGFGVASGDACLW